jgi:hypothetical protein
LERLSLISSSGGGGNTGAGVMMKVGDPGVETREFLSAFPPLEPLLLSFLSSCGSVFLLNDVVTPGRGDHLLVVDIDQARHLSDRGPVAPQLIGVNDLWDIEFPQQLSQEGPRRLGIPMPLKENVKHEAVLVDSPPEPMANTIDARTHFVEMPP